MLYTCLQMIFMMVECTPGSKIPSFHFHFQLQGKAQEVANVIAFLLGPERTFVSGSVYAVDGAWL